uniref:Usp domain-containing protein n=1 Tax=Macrostomum lignano TaxID=282301 RepID=A0A1I8F7I3_9PLAT
FVSSVKGNKTKWAGTIATNAGLQPLPPPPNPALGPDIPRPERRVLIAVDGSKGAQRAFDYWSSMPGSQSDSIILLHSMEATQCAHGTAAVPSGTFDYEEYEKQGRQLKQRSQQLSQEADGPVREAPPSLQVSCPKPVLPGATIVEAARKYAANVVVVGCRGNNGIRRTILGSVSDYVLQHSCRPVVVVPEIN